MQPYQQASSSATYSRSSSIDSLNGTKESQMSVDHTARQARELADEVLREYEANQARLAKAIDASLHLIGDMRNFNGKQWTIRYPHLRASEGGESQIPHRPGMARRTVTFADEPIQPQNVVINSTPTRSVLKRTMTLAPESTLPSSTPGASSSSYRSEDSEDFSILRLNLNMGATRHAQGLIAHLEKSSISQLLDNRLGASLDHLTLLQERVQDPHSRVLVTGDLNAGKSTLINALLRQTDVMPTDEQPLTTRFVEVVSAKENNGLEEIHILDKSKKYDQADQSTYTIEPIQSLEQIATDFSNDADAPPVRVYLNEIPTLDNEHSILHNGVVDISLIDAPGLNRDSIKTTANFARQEEIDVVVFVVSAANHFTLSAKEFIWQAGHEKAHLFIVVNRFDQIKDKERCRKAVLEQIKQLSPKTYAEAADLVHFVDSAKVAMGWHDAPSEKLDEAFSHLEHSLRSFVLVNRTKSKLGPAQNYVTHLLADVELLASANMLVATKEKEKAREEMERVKPALEKLKKGKESLEENLVQEEEKATDSASSRTRQAMIRALERVSKGELAAPAPGLELPSYPGFLGVWDYAKDTKRVLLASLDFATSLAEVDARKITTEGVDKVGVLGDQYLPEDVDKTRRVFNPNAMFSGRPGQSSKSSRRPSTSQLGLGLASQSHLLQINVSDILDLQHHIFLARSQLPPLTSSESTSKDLIPFGTEVGGLGLASLAFGAFTLSGKSFAIKSVIDGMISISDFASHPMTRKWIGPVLGAFAVGGIIYIIYDLPRSIPKNIGRHINQTLTYSSGTSIGTDDEKVSFPEYQSIRVGKEVRKVMRLASWDLRERYKAAVDVKKQIVVDSELVEKKADGALKYFKGLEGKVEEIREQVSTIKI